MNNKRSTICWGFLALVLTNCKIKIPEKSVAMKENAYNIYKANLEKAISNKDNFEIGIQLCNLEVKKETVYGFLRKGIKENKGNCAKVLKWNQLYIENNFKVNPIKLDSSAWKMLCLLCQNDKKGVDAFQQNEYESMKKYEESRKRIKIDSSKFDKQLITELTIIYADDQRYRGKDDDESWKLQTTLDSMNFKKVEQIIKSRPYPSYNEVGLDLLDAIFLVLHHQKDIAIRKKYLPYLEEAVKSKNLSKGLLEIYVYRTKLLE